MILSPTVTRDGYSASFPLYEQGSGTVRYDVHVRIEPTSDTLAMLGAYDRKGECWLNLELQVAKAHYRIDTGMHATDAVVVRVAGEVQRRYGKRLPSEVQS